MDEFISVEGITKSFGGAIALSDVSIKIRSGVVHGFVGANGAGKSTLIKCLAGVVTPDAGTFRINGNKASIDNPAAARQHGFAFIHQEMSLIEPWEVMRNLSLGVPYSTKGGLIE